MEWMSYLLVAVSAFLAAGLTMYSGFGLGTLMLPVFALFLPVEMAVVATALVLMVHVPPEILAPRFIFTLSAAIITSSRSRVSSRLHPSAAASSPNATSSRRKAPARSSSRSPETI